MSIVYGTPQLCIRDYTGKCIIEINETFEINENFNKLEIIKLELKQCCALVQISGEIRLLLAKLISRGHTKSIFITHLIGVKFPVIISGRFCLFFTRF